MDRGSDKTMSKGTAFTRSRSYTYGSSSRPHAVTEVDNTDGRIMLGNAQNSSWSHNLAAITDHLGSIMALWDNNDPYYSCSYDVWGNRTIGMESPLGIDRGFCGHEHIDEIGLIDMNGRMYDPKLGRFLSPDPYIQAPTDPQNFNRYSYCLNNPLKYTDPNGESIAAIAAIGLFAYGMINLFVQADNGNIDTFGDAVNALIGGAAAGLSEASSWAIGFAGIASGTPLGVLLGMEIMSGKSWNMTTTVASCFADTKNAAKIYLGRYYTDGNGNAWDQALQGLSRFTWEGPQTWAGYNWSQIRNLFGNVDEVDYLGGATFSINENSSKNNGVSLGNYININISTTVGPDFIDKVKTNPLFMHEYGHTFDSREAGPVYLFTIGVPSMFSAIISSFYRDIEVNGITTTRHKLFWTEQRASRHAYKYFNRYYGVDIKVFDRYLPYDQPKN